jgi:hypothetical protein
MPTRVGVTRACISTAGATGVKVPRKLFEYHANYVTLLRYQTSAN